MAALVVHKHPVADQLILYPCMYGFSYLFLSIYTLLKMHAQLLVKLDFLHSELNHKCRQTFYTHFIQHKKIIIIINDYLKIILPWAGQTRAMETKNIFNWSIIGAVTL